MGGTPATIGTIDRTQNFTYELIVTPAHYTTVKWYIDEEEVAEGLTIDVPVLAGEHIVKIVATTTQGKSTSRTCKLTVRSIAGDPELATDAKSRWLTIGSTMTIDCANATNSATKHILIPALRRPFCGKVTPISTGATAMCSSQLLIWPMYL